MGTQALTGIDRLRALIPAARSGAPTRGGLERLRTGRPASQRPPAPRATAPSPRSDLLGLRAIDDELGVTTAYASLMSPRPWGAQTIGTGAFLLTPAQRHALVAERTRVQDRLHQARLACRARRQTVDTLAHLHPATAAPDVAPAPALPATAGTLGRGAYVGALTTAGLYA